MTLGRPFKLHQVVDGVFYPVEAWGPFYWHGLTLISAWISNYIHHIVWDEITNDGILLIGTLGTNFSVTLIEILTFSFNKMHLKMLSAKWRLFRLGLNVLTVYDMNND